MSDDFIYRYRFAVGSILIVIILVGLGLVIWHNYSQSHQNRDNQLAEIQQQNDLLRAELANQNQAVAGATTESQTQSEKININTADLIELDKVPGIGPAIAARIIDWRNQNGAFQVIDDIKKVKGIGDKTFEKMKDVITIGE